MREQLTIIRTPEGDAPLWVREAWIRLTLPVAQASGPKRFGWAPPLLSPSDPVVLPLQPAQAALSVEGYAVSSLAALLILERANPMAADWWRDNHPEAFDDEQIFIFDIQACDPGGQG